MYKTDDYVTGTVLYATAENSKVFRHCGIVEVSEGKVWVWHNTPGQVNSKGGNVVRDPVEKFFENRSFITSKKITLGLGAIVDRVREVEHYKFNLLFWNCEHFENYVTEGHAFSPQLRLVIIALIAIYLIRKNELRNRY